MTTSSLQRAWADQHTVITDGGLETWLVFQKGIDLPAFAAYPLAAMVDGRALLSEYYENYARIARDADVSVVLETPTWRANPDWAATLGHDRAALAVHIAAAVDVVGEICRRWTGTQSFAVGGAVGPRGDGYRIDKLMDVAEATDYHSFQIEHMAAAGVHVISGITIGYVEEAIGIARAAAAVGLPSVISFTVEIDGRLPSGMTLAEAIEITDAETAATDATPVHYMINCAHPEHFEGVLDGSSQWAARIGGLRANASKLSHAELDEMTELDDGDPEELAAAYVALRSKLPSLKVIGGCCGTDERHVAAIAAAWGSAATS